MKATAKSKSILSLYLSDGKAICEQKYRTKCFLCLLLRSDRPSALLAVISHAGQRLSFSDLALSNSYAHRETQKEFTDEYTNGLRFY